MRLAGQASRSNKFEIFRASDHRNNLFSDLEGYLRKLACRVTWPSFGNTTVIQSEDMEKSNAPIGSGIKSSQLSYPL
jgi:hypothetical protein